MTEVSPGSTLEVSHNYFLRAEQINQGTPLAIRPKIIARLVHVAGCGQLWTSDSVPCHTEWSRQVETKSTTTIQVVIFM